MTTRRSAPVIDPHTADRHGLAPLFTAKLLPPRPSFRIVDRTRLIDRVSSGVGSAPLTLISAPAGAGKTILAAAWADGPGRTLPVSWITVDDGDAQPGVFWSHVLDALVQNGVIPARAARPTHPETVDSSFIERLAADLLARRDPIVLVLDEADRLKGCKVAGQLDLLLRYAEQRLRLVVVTRADPVLALHRHRLDGTVAEIRYDDLAFTAGETHALLEYHGVTASELTTKTLVDRTEGWAAGIRLAALALQQQAATAYTVEEIEACLGPKDSLVAEYLIAEVLHGMPASDRDFLLHTSVVRDISPGLADELTGRRDSQRVLTNLSHCNAFLQQVPRSPGSYRMHSLFNEFLRVQLMQEAPGEVAELHRRAADWFAGIGRIADAVEHAMAAGDYDGAAGLVIERAAIGMLLLPTTTGTRMARSLSGIPADVDSPEVSVVRAAVALARGDLDRAQGCLARCEDHLGSAGAHLVLAAAVVRTRLCAANGEAESTIAAAGHAREAWCALSADHAMQHQDLWVLVLSSEGIAHLRAGNFDAACTRLGEALVVAASNGSEAERLRCLAMLGLAEACRGRLSRGQELADTAESFAVESAVVAAERPAAAHLAHAWVALERQQLAGAQRWLARAGRLAETRSDGLLASVSTLLQARLRRDRGDIEGARHMLRSHAVRQSWLHALIDTEAVALGLPRCVSGDTAPPRAARGYGGSAREQATHDERREMGVETPSVTVEHLLRRAQRHCARGDLGAGRSAVLRAMALAEDERIRRPFTHIPQQVRSLIRTEPAVYVRAAWLWPEHSSSPRRQPGPADVPRVDRALSEKELEVLRHLSALLTTEEIAAAMFISVNTVKTHISSILRKLSVSRRNEAIRRARELKIV
jgi:LuxR family transcriptional regulator, maltose regulon positive regulatory protein